MGDKGHTLRSQDDPYLFNWKQPNDTSWTGTWREDKIILVIFCLEVDTKFYTYVVMHFVSGINVIYYMGFH